MSNILEELNARADALAEKLINQVYKMLIDKTIVTVLYDLDGSKHVWVNFENDSDQQMFNELVDKAANGNDMSREVIERFKETVQKKADTM